MLVSITITRIKNWFWYCCTRGYKTVLCSIHL